MVRGRAARKAVREREAEIRSIVTTILDGVVERGSFDFVKDVAVPLPLTVLMGLMGVPESDMDRLYGWTHEIERAQQSVEPEAATDTFAEMAEYLHEQIEVQKRDGGDSLVNRLREAEVDGERLDDDEILVFFGLLVFAGNDTTHNTASAGALALLSHPDQWQTLQSDPELIPQAVEEILRYSSVVNYFSRTATVDTEVGGRQISQGDKVLLWYTSASRDEDEEDPQRFDITRTGQSHNAFGGGGPHFCLGNYLARLELKVLFEELTRRMPSLEVAGPVERLSSNWAKLADLDARQVRAGVARGSLTPGRPWVTQGPRPSCCLAQGVTSCTTKAIRARAIVTRMATFAFMPRAQATIQKTSPTVMAISISIKPPRSPPHRNRARGSRTSPW